MLERFLLDPEGFDPRGELRAEPIYLDPKLIKEFLTRGVDLGSHVLPALTKDGKRVPSYRQRVVVLKTLYGWLRATVHRLQPAEDPTFGRLKAPKSKSAQGDGSSKVIPVKEVLAVVDWLRAEGQQPEALKGILAAAKAHLAGSGRRSFEVKAVAQAAGTSTSHIYYYFKDRDDLLTAAKSGVYAANGSWKPGASRWPDMLLFLLATGWHVTELHRFMVDGAIEAIPEEGAQDPRVAGVAVVVCKKSKRGNKLPQWRHESMGVSLGMRGRWDRRDRREKKTAEPPAWTAPEGK